MLTSYRSFLYVGNIFYVRLVFLTFRLSFQKRQQIQFYHAEWMPWDEAGYHFAQ